MGGLGFVEVEVGFLDSFEAPGDGDDAVGEVELGEVLGVETVEVGVAEVVEGLGGLCGEEEVRAEEGVGGTRVDGFRA